MKSLKDSGYDERLLDKLAEPLPEPICEYDLSEYTVHDNGELAKVKGPTPTTSRAFIADILKGDLVQDRMT